MDINEAYDLTLNKLEELKNTGVIIKMTPIKSNESGLLDKSKWVEVSIACKDYTQTSAMWRAKVDLFNLGITFNSGVDMGYGNESILIYVWQLDNSFKYEGE